MPAWQIRMFVVVFLIANAIGFALRFPYMSFGVSRGYWRHPSARKILELGTVVPKYGYGRCPDTMHATLAFPIGLAFHFQAMAPFSRCPLGFYTSRICPIPIGVPQGMCDPTPCDNNKNYSKILTFTKPPPPHRHKKHTVYKYGFF